MPFSSAWHKVNKQEVPVNAVWLSAFISLCMALPVTDLKPFGYDNPIVLLTFDNKTAHQVFSKCVVTG
jgi:amino acid transporter